MTGDVCVIGLRFCIGEGFSRFGMLFVLITHYFLLFLICFFLYDTFLLISILMR